ncbi:peroxiredoxin Q/BCP [Methanocalculus alkaliphilus]|uniref:thioredoxin-dependent thiol peroxidase n=1 Tax=Methanocalculus alkaliphilus TaxID=768730 RepID=UPI00209FF70C|nr:thioredoxin-dependent thiol peroxidase [Methanocalculus alkaliphilus]MCP1715288.1 peroxiredoxin Q/BCP [Methanocalculus alkaliphilus]
MTDLTIGMVAPEFCLPDADEEMACLEEMRGYYVIVYFYPRDNTSACTLEARTFSDEMEAFAALNTPVLGISPDTISSHRKFAEKHSLTVRLLSDPEHQVIERYGVWVSKKMYGKEYMGVERSTFIIDPDGKIAAIWRKVKVKGHIDEVMTRLRDLKGEEK